MTHDIRHAAVLALAIGCALAGTSCGKRPSQFCDEYVAEYTAAYERCGFTPPCFLTHPVRTGECVPCSDIGGINNHTELSSVCYPWLRSASCAEIGSPPHIAECSAMHFEILVDR